MEDTTGTTGAVPATPTPDPLPLTKTLDAPVVALTIDERVERMEKVLRDYITNPPKLADAEVLRTMIDAVKGMAQSALTQVKQLSDDVPDRISALTARMGSIEKDVADVASAKEVPLVAKVRDMAHESARAVAYYECPADGTGYSREILTSRTNAAQVPCPTCGRSSDAVRIEKVVDAPPAVTDAPVLAVA